MKALILAIFILGVVITVHSLDYAEGLKWNKNARKRNKNEIML